MTTVYWPWRREIEKLPDTCSRRSGFLFGNIDRCSYEGFSVLAITDFSADSVHSWFFLCCRDLCRQRGYTRNKKYKD